MIPFLCSSYVSLLSFPVQHSLGQQIDPSLMLSMMGSDIKLPPKPPRTVFPEYYRTRQQLHLLQLQQRRRQEMELFMRLKSMSVEQLKKFQAKLSPTQLQQLIERIKYLQQQMNQQKQGTPRQQVHGLGEGQRNMVLSGANRIRRPSASMNSAQTFRGSAVSHSSRRPSAYSAMAQRLGAIIRQRHRQLVAGTKKPSPVRVMSLSVCPSVSSSVFSFSVFLFLCLSLSLCL